MNAKDARARAVNTFEMGRTTSNIVWRNERNAISSNAQLRCEPETNGNFISKGTRTTIKMRCSRIRAYPLKCINECTQIGIQWRMHLATLCVDRAECACSHKAWVSSCQVGDRLRCERVAWTHVFELMHTLNTAKSRSTTHQPPTIIINESHFVFLCWSCGLLQFKRKHLTTLVRPLRAAPRIQHHIHITAIDNVFEWVGIWHRPQGQRHSYVTL